VELEPLVLRVYILDVRVAAVGLGGVELGLRMRMLVATGRKGERGIERERGFARVDDVLLPVPPLC
jgi:hypothetical protein